MTPLEEGAGLKAGSADPLGDVCPGALERPSGTACFSKGGEGEKNKRHLEVES